MNPLDMMGPAFLAFYALYGIVGFALVLLIKARREADNPAGRWMPGQYPREEDAYHLALLRGGSSQVAQTLVGRLVSSGFARVEEDQIVPADPPLEPRGRLLPIEKTALAALPAGARAATETIGAAVQPEIDVMRNELTIGGLVPNPEQAAALRRLLGATLVAIPGLGVLKLLVALARGRTNVLFLIFMIVGYALLTILLLRVPSRTRAGERYLSWLRESHQGLLGQLRNESGQYGGALNLALAAGIFGLAAVPQMEPVDRVLRPPLTSGGDSGSSSSGCGSDSSGGDGGGGDSGGDSGGDGGGSSCGGGGCGGCGGGGGD